MEKIKAVLGRAGEISSHVQRMIHQSSPETRPCDLHVALRNVLSLLEHKLHLGSHEVEVDLTSQAPSVMGDPTEFEQLFLALICHACEASPGGGTIRVQTADLSGVVEVQIHDAGMGLPPAHVATLFDPFTGSGPGEGASGLGLAICKNIVSRFQGTIRVDSAMGKGTAFTIRLPAVGQEHRARWAVPKWPDTPVPEERGGGAGREVALMVAPAEAAVIHAWLDGAGLTVRQYSTNVQALETLPAHRDGVLIVSLDRLGLEALDFLRTIHERRLVATVVVVVESDEVQTVTSWDRVPPLRMVVRPLGREPLLQAVMLAELASGSGAGPA
ncbi:MAG: hybrid sensor histidine kinase/response regulator [Candidatus Riflebacteria bacterium]|nr:hybrid sensor histidine kinase/response regulator [Candidatus Riflebacteria bacterium]